MSQRMSGVDWALKYTAKGGIQLIAKGGINWDSFNLTHLRPKPEERSLLSKSFVLVQFDQDFQL